MLNMTERMLLLLVVADGISWRRTVLQLALKATATSCCWLGPLPRPKGTDADAYRKYAVRALVEMASFSASVCLEYIRSLLTSARTPA